MYCSIANQQNIFISMHCNDDCVHFGLVDHVGISQHNTDSNEQYDYVTSASVRPPLKKSAGTELCTTQMTHTISSDAKTFEEKC